MSTNKKSKKKILEKIEELLSEQRYHRGIINTLVRAAEKNGYAVLTYEGMTFVHYLDGTVPDPIQSTIRKHEGVIQGLQFAIDALKIEL